MKNNNNNNFEFLDSIGITSFAAQLKNMSDDKVQTDYIREVIKAIAVEIEKLHKENDKIIEMLREIKERGK